MNAPGVICERCARPLPDDRLGVCPHCFLDEDPEATVRIGDSLELMELVGEGGMGRVHRGYHHRLQREVAVKFLPEALQEDSGHRARFEREARALALLAHPNIVTVHDFGTHSGRPYIVMEFVEGAPLSERTGMSLAGLLPILHQLVDAMSYAHEKGVVHRDLKPQNLLLTLEGRLKVTDFGLARPTEIHGWTITAPDRVSGTLPYMSPESLAGAEPDPRMDVYSIGVLIHVMLTGELPLARLADLDPRIAPVVSRALERDPAARFPTVRSLGDALPLTRGSAPAARLSAAESTAGLDPSERNWIRVVAMIFVASSSAVVWAGVTCLTPRVVEPGERFPLVMRGLEALPDGRFVSLARFEVGPILTAFFTLIVAAAAYTLLESAWARHSTRLKPPDPDLDSSRRILALGTLGIVVYGLRLWLERDGPQVYSPFVPVVGGILEILVLYLFWTRVLEGWRNGTTLSKDAALWVGLGLALVPPLDDFVRFIQTWTP